MVREISLTQGQVAQVADNDYERLLEVKWLARWNALTQLFYASRQVATGCSKMRHLYMHNAIWEWHHGPIPDDLTVDHIDRNTLNNQLSNFRLATFSQQMQNRGLFKNNKSGYRGVGWHKGCEKWQARIRVDGKLIHLGYYDDKDDAARAYDAAARIHFGEFAVLNFPQEVAA